MRLRLPATLLAVALAASGLAACSQESTAQDPGPSAGGSSAGSTGAAACGPVSSLPLHQAGQLTVATDSPAYDPWYKHNDPSNGQGYESAVAYAVAKQMGFSANQVHWVKEAFNSSYTPGDKPFDFDINQISITPDRAKAVEFSAGYYTDDQAVITLKKDASEADSLAGLKQMKLGAETATTSLTAIRDDVQPSQQPLVFDTDDEAKQALVNGQIDGVVTDLASAGYMSSEIPGSVVVGKFQNKTPEQFGLLLAQGNPLVSCVDYALGKVKSSGQLAALEKKWLSGMENVPVLK